MSRASLVLLIALLFSSAIAAAADTRAAVTLHDGLATVVAHDATIAEVLDAWARAGGTAIVNGEKMSGQRLTLELVDVPEKDALDVVLRSAAAYIAITRSAVSPAASRYERIMILATSVAPRETSPPPSAQRPVFAPPPPPAFVPPPPPASVPPAQGVQRLIGPDGQPVADDQEGAPPPNRRAAPFGFTTGDAPPAREPAAPPSQTIRPPAGVPVPGMIVGPPQQPRAPRD